VKAICLSSARDRPRAASRAPQAAFTEQLGVL
jgi:hypothetical protein